MALNLLEELPIDSCRPSIDPAGQAAATAALENGRVLYLPRLGFAVTPDECQFLLADWSDGKSKNIYLRGAERKLRGARGRPAELDALAHMLERFAEQAQQLAGSLLPAYAPSLEAGNTSFRPCEIAGRPSSFRKDDTRLYPDAFPSNPTQGARILRVFTNVNPHGKARTWRIGEPFADVARKFLPGVRRQWPGEAALLGIVGVTKRRRTEYDHLMLQLHDHIKADLTSQQTCPQQEAAFPPGSTWIVFSDQVLHAVMGGQFMLGQTWMLPANALRDPEASPLRVLERMTGRALA